MALNWEIISHDKMVAQGTLSYQIRSYYDCYSVYVGLASIGTFVSQMEAIKACEKYEKDLRGD